MSFSHPLRKARTLAPIRQHLKRQLNRQDMLEEVSRKSLPSLSNNILAPVPLSLPTMHWTQLQESPSQGSLARTPIAAQARTPSSLQLHINSRHVSSRNNR